MPKSKLYATLAACWISVAFSSVVGALQSYAYLSGQSSKEFFFSNIGLHAFSIVVWAALGVLLIRRSALALAPMFMILLKLMYQVYETAKWAMEHAYLEVHQMAIILLVASALIKLSIAEFVFRAWWRKDLK